MSHNKITIGGNSPDQQGNVLLDLGDLSDVSISSASNDEILTKTALGWGASSAPLDFASIEVGFYALATASWGVGAYYYGINDYLTNVTGHGWVTTTNRSQFNTSRTTHSPIQQNSFSMSYNVLGAGTWLCFMGVACASGTSATWQLYNNSGAFSHKVKVYNSISNAQNAMLTGIFTTTGNDIVRAVLVDKVGSLTLHNTSENLCTGVTILKIG